MPVWLAALGTPRTSDRLRLRMQYAASGGGGKESHENTRARRAHKTIM